jgi:hypothetical protein
MIQCALPPSLGNAIVPYFLFLLVVYDITQLVNYLNISTSGANEFLSLIQPQVRVIIKSHLLAQEIFYGI